MAEPPSSITISPACITAPKVSVLVPICNVERYLEECLDSLLAQTFVDFEVLCINDGSTDGSRAVIQRYLDVDERFRVLDKPNSGYGASMNMGLANACGEYIAILESDDFFEPNALELLVEAAERSQSDVVKGDFYLYWSKPEKRYELFHIVDNREIGHTVRPIDDFAIFFRKPSIWSGLYRASFLAENGIGFLETPGASYQDAGFNFKVWASAERATFIADPVLYYRQDNEKSSVNSAAKVRCVCDEYASMTDFVLSQRGADRKLLGILERMKFDSYLWNYDRLSNELRLEFLELASREFASDIASGMVDLALFEPWAKAELAALADDPQRFVEVHSASPASGFFDSLRRYMALGGLPLVFSELLYRIFKSSNRRTNASGGAA